MRYRWLVAIPNKPLLASLALLNCLFLLLVGCSIDDQSGSGTPGELIVLKRSQNTTSVTATIATAPVSRIDPTATPKATLTPATAATPVTIVEETQIATPTAAHTATPEPISGGIRPFEASLQRPPETGPDSPVEWRPPPVPAPHALHPDDHYWLARPLSSDRRNYDLEVYPYGNVPVLLSLRPYRVHHGMDFPNDKGSPIFAAGSGTVIFAGPRPNPNSGINYYGNTVIILHDWQWNGQNVYTLYAHTLELFVEVGDSVEQGQLIAGVGASGEVSGPHLHLEVRIGANHYDYTHNPALWLAPFEGWGTLAGRFIDNRGQLIHGALITVRPVDVESEVTVPVRHQLTYAPFGINSDDIWNENFAFSDLPAGEYTVEFRTAGHIYRRSAEVKPEITNYIVVQADIRWVPTAVPTATPTMTPTVTPSSTP